MRGILAGPVLAAGTALLVGCGTSGGGAGLACTEIAALRGISLTVAEDMAPAVGSAELEVCGETCRTHRLDLLPGTDTIDLGCTGTGPEGTCSASSSPNGTLVGFAEDPDLDVSEVDLTLTVSPKGGGDPDVYELTAVPALVYPNGKGCPGEAAQLAVVLTAQQLTALPPASPTEDAVGGY